MSHDQPAETVHQAPASEVIQRVAEALEATESAPKAATITLTQDAGAGPLLPRRAG